MKNFKIITKSITHFSRCKLLNRPIAIALSLGLLVGISAMSIHGANSQDSQQSNLINPTEIKAGQEFLGLDVVDVNLHPFGADRWVGEVTFRGEVTVSGTYKPNTHLGESDRGIPCFFVDDATQNRLPRIQGDERLVWFCFNNPQEVKSILGESERNVAIIINSYKTIYVPTDVTDLATFVQIAN